jgi:hypothetical protein
MERKKKFKLTLTDQQLAEMGKSIAHVTMQIESLEAEKKKILKGYNDQLKNLHDSIHETVMKIDEGYALIDKAVREVKNPVTFLIEYFDPETGEPTLVYDEKTRENVYAVPVDRNTSQLGIDDEVLDGAIGNNAADEGEEVPGPSPAFKDKESDTAIPDNFEDILNDKNKDGEEKKAAAAAFDLEPKKNAENPAVAKAKQRAAEKKSAPVQRSTSRIDKKGIKK